MKLGSKDGFKEGNDEGVSDGSKDGMSDGNSDGNLEILIDPPHTQQASDTDLSPEILSTKGPQATEGDILRISTSELIDSQVVGEFPSDPSMTQVGSSTQSLGASVIKKKIH